MEQGGAIVEDLHKASAHGYEFWRPVISPQYLDRVQALHRELAGEIAPAAAERTGHAVRWRLVAVDFKALSAHLAEMPAESHTALLGGERLQCAGLIGFSSGLALAMVHHGLNLESEPHDGVLSPIERSVLWQAVEGLAAAILRRYEEAGLSRLSIVRQADAHVLGESLSASREVVVFRFDAESTPWWISVALDTDLVLHLADSLLREAAPQGRVVDIDALGEIALRTSVTVYRFNASLEALCRLRVGERLLLPDADEARLVAAGGKDLLRLKVELDARNHRAICTVVDDEAHP